MKLRRIAELKFEVIEKTIFDTGIQWRGPSLEVRDPLTGELLIDMHPSGWLVVYPGYMFDGPSGPTVDDTTNIGPSALHDALYEILRGVGEMCFTRKQADQVMYTALMANVRRAHDAAMVGASKARQAWLVTKRAVLLARYATWYRGLRWFAFYAARRRALEDKYMVYEVL